MYNAIICRYHEIATKGDNRSFFERTMLENLRRILRMKFPDLRYRRVRGRIWMEFADRRDFSADELQQIREELTLRALGIESFSPAIVLKPEMNLIEETVRRAAETVVAPAIEKAHREGRTLRFRFRARRSDKNFPLRSQEIEIALTSLLGGIYGRENLKLDLVNADLSIGVEVREEMAIIFLESFSAPGGLPVGCNDRTLALLSGGIDSPVACYLTMKRGSPVDFIGFHSAPYTPPETEDKVQRIADYLNTFQQPGRLYMVNIVELQKLVRDNCNPRLRTVLYRRFMFRIAAGIARKKKIGALLTGESLGQVASQTLVNMNTIGQAVSDMLVLRPLCGQDKMETIAIAERIGSFELSKEQVPDSCTVFAPDKASTRVSVQEAEAEEARIPGYWEIIDRLVNEALAAAAAGERA